MRSPSGRPWHPYRKFKRPILEWGMPVRSLSPFRIRSLLIFSSSDFRLSMSVGSRCRDGVDVQCCGC
jgi:hypothetical protein